MENKKSRILVVVDMQNDFIDGSLGSKEAEGIVPNVVSKIKNWNGDWIIATKDVHFSNYLHTLEGKHLPIKHCIEGTKGVELHPEVEKALSETQNWFTVTKSGFTGPIKEELTRKEISTTDLFSMPDEYEFEIIGLCTDICVISNALNLRYEYPDAEITIDAQCCAGTSKSNHESALNVMEVCGINIKR